MLYHQLVKMAGAQQPSTITIGGGYNPNDFGMTHYYDANAATGINLVNAAVGSQTFNAAALTGGVVKR